MLIHKGVTIETDFQKIRNKRVIKFLFSFLFFVLILIFRLVYLQIDQGRRFLGLGKKNFLRTEVIAPIRGNLLDCNGNLLAANRPIFDLYWAGSGNLCFSEKQNELLSKLQSILKESLEKNFINKIKYSEKYSKELLIKSNINFEELCCISEQFSDYSNLLIKNRFKRIYPYKNLASHILGYLSRQEQDYTTIGLSGLEKIFQDQLKGEVGYILNIINSKGSRLKKKDFKDAKSGSDIVLTLDLNLQSIAENLFEEDQAGAFVLMDVNDGSIKAMVSYPNFDSNIFLDPISQKNWDLYLTNNNPLLNRVTRAVYPPASLFKLITFAAGLEEGVITTTTQFNCKGFTSFCGRKYHCIRRWGHGDLDCKTSLAYSCNIPCFEIAKKIKINQFADYAYRFGLGLETGFLLNEHSGLVPTYEWKVATKGESWWKGETLSVSIGQGYTLVTPLQMARMVASICSGYLVKPRILEKEEVLTDKLEISENSLKFLRKAMRGVVKIGSAKILNKIKDFEIFAKTGTAQTSSLRREKISKQHLEHAWLASYFAYKDQPPLAMVVLVEHVGSSAPARKIAGKFLTMYKKTLEKDNF